MRDRYKPETAALIMRDQLGLGPDGARLLFDDVFRDASNETLQAVAADIFTVFNAHRIDALPDVESRGRAARALRTSQELLRIVGELLDCYEHAPTCEDAECAAETQRRIAKCVEAVQRINKAGFRKSPERLARMYFLRDLQSAASVYRAGQMMRVGGGGMMIMSIMEDEGDLEILGRARETGWVEVTKGRIARASFGMAWPEYASELTPGDYDDAVEIFEQNDNARKWDRLAEYVAKGNMGRVSGAALSADWRKWRAPENQDLGDDDPEK